MESRWNAPPSSNVLRIFHFGRHFGIICRCNNITIVNFGRTADARFCRGFIRFKNLHLTGSRRSAAHSR